MRAQPGCDAYTLYYGRAGHTGSKPDFKAALDCASAPDQDETDPLGSTAVLATIYANGSGVPRNLDRAAVYVCRMNLAEAEKEGMLESLDGMRGHEATAKPFRVCDHVTSKMLGDLCFDREEADRAAQDEDYFQDLQSRLKGSANSCLAKLRAAAQAFAGALSSNESDMTGTAGSVLAAEAERSQKDAFRDLLLQVMSDSLPAARPLAETDKDLNAVYGRIMKSKDKTVTGTVDKDGVRATQKTWLIYRDEFASFAVDVAPALSNDNLKSLLTERRTKQLLDLSGS